MVGTTRRAFLKGAAGMGLASVLPGCAATGIAGAARPNVVLIITDDQGYGDLGCHGNPHLQTPNLDGLHGESTRLTRFYVSPVCAPTRASLMTGRYNYRTGVVDTYIGRAMMYPEETTLAELLSNAGYRTGIFGKWHLGDNYPLRAMDQGFQECLTHNGGGIGQPSDPPETSYFDPILQHNGEQKQYKGYCTDVFTDATIDFVRDSGNRPFFAYLSTNAPHTPLEISDAYVEPYKAMGLDETTAKVYGMITNIDDNVGRLLAALEDAGVADNTLVIFMTDNGGQMPRDAQRYNAGLRGTKGTVYEGGIRVPCFLRLPGQIEPGRDVDGLAAHIDLAPTILQACKVSTDATEAMDGSSRWHSLAPGETRPAAPAQRDDEPRVLQWHRGDVPEPFRASAVVEQRFKLVNGEELYDLEADPGEQNDLAAAHPEEVARLRAYYEAWFADVSEGHNYAPPRIHLGTRHETR
jgi:arylsulfatase A-like enzyme